MERSLADHTRTHLRLADLANRKPTHFDLTPDAGKRTAIAADVGVTSIKKLRLQGQITPAGKRDWTLTADLGATVVQDCVVTLAPVTTRIDEPIKRIYLADYTPPAGNEVEMTDDDTIDPLPESIDLFDLLSEALVLALPPFPRAPGAELGQTVHTEPGQAPMTDDDAKPFAGLGDLRDALQKNADDDAT